MNAGQLHTKLTYAELNPKYATDCRRIIREERIQLGLAMRTGDAARIKAAFEEALRVAEMWNVSL